MRAALVIALLFFGCESGTSRVVRVTVPEVVSSGFSSSARGVLVIDVGGQARGVAVLCGQQLPSPVVMSDDLGFGCLGGRAGQMEDVGVWIQPMPAGWTERECSASRPFYDPDVTPADGGVPFEPRPQPSWVQTVTTGTWARDASPCGGSLKVSVTLAR